MSNYPGWGPWPDYTTCPACKGTRAECALCDGLGVVTEAEAEQWQAAPAARGLTKCEALALALSLNKPAGLAAYAHAELQRLYNAPPTCWRCDAALPDPTGPEGALRARGELGGTCPACSADLVPC